jgi:hypothetical protein
VSSSPDLQVVEGCDAVIEHEHPLVPEGEYLATYVDHEVCEVLKFRKKDGKQTAKLYIHWKLVNAGEHSGKVLFQPLGVKARITKKRFKPWGRGSKLLKMFCRVLNPRGRLDRINLKAFSGCVVKVRVCTVVRDHEGEAVHPGLQYSKVEDVLNLETFAHP